MSTAACDPAQIVMLAFEDIESSTRALEDLRELRSYEHIHAESMALLRWETNGERSCTVERADMRYPEGALLAALADVLMQMFADRSVETGARRPIVAPGKKTAVKRIDRGICSARLKPLRSYLLPGNSAIVALVRESEMVRVVRVLANSRPIAGAREVWVDLELDLDVLIADVLGRDAAFSPMTAGAAWLNVARSHISSEIHM